LRLSFIEKAYVKILHVDSYLDSKF
jgi:hypothetical protein